MTRIYTATVPWLDEPTEVLVTIWDDDTAEVAVRQPPHPSVTWSPPTPLTEEAS